MSQPCRDLVCFADGELEPGSADEFRAHLATCAECQRGLLEALQLSMRLGALPQAAEHAVAAAHEPSDRGKSATPPLVVPVRPPKPRPRWTRWVAPGTGAVVAAAAIAGWVISWPGSKPPDVFAALETRPGDIRFAYGDAARYRPRDEMRGSGGRPRDRISRTELAALEDHDKHGLAIAMVWNGENLTEAAGQLRNLEQTPSVRSDRTAIEILTTNNDNVESVLTELEALRASSDPVVARAARWNYAILLSRLDLPLGAAQAFRAIADEHEPGWADEARARSAAAASVAQNARATWERAVAAGEALVAHRTLVPTDLLRQVPGVTRAYFYKAVRTAETREQALALAPMAAELDRLDDEPILGDYVRRVAELDFRRRAPLARAYMQLLREDRHTAELEAKLITSTASSDVADIVMGAMIELEVAGDHLEAFRRMVRQANDPWFDLSLAQLDATLEVQHGNWFGAEARLQKAQKLCRPAVTYQCLKLARQRGKLYADLHRVSEAIEVVSTAVRLARTAGEWPWHRQLLLRLADVERFNSSTATARAYANEVLLANDRCDESNSYAYLTLTGAALLDLDGRAARRNLEDALRCAAPDLNLANYLADIGRLDPQRGDLAQLRGWLGKLRASTTLTVAQRVLADELEGRLLIERDRAAGTALLEGAIAAAGTLPREVAAIGDQARAGAYSVLVLDAARHRDNARVVALIAQALGLPQPVTCVVAMLAEDERAVVVVRGADGQDHADYRDARGPRAGAPAVSPELARGLEGCSHVQVMAHAALQGQPHVLPPTVAWSYATGARRVGSPRDDAPAEPHRLIVANVMPPPELQLPALSQQPPDLAPTSRMLSGPAATPDQVLTAMGTASEIEFHTHALVNMGISDASYLVLSPGLDGRYALTVEAIRGAALRHHPMVVLAACHAAQGARYQHAPWSLPHAFLSVGARAVFAAATEIPDSEAGPFFARVLERVRTGTDPAVALRDHRMAALASNPSSWVADVILFE